MIVVLQASDRFARVLLNQTMAAKARVKCRKCFVAGRNDFSLD
jgi:hypothetical protein